MSAININMLSCSCVHLGLMVNFGIAETATEATECSEKAKVDETAATGELRVQYTFQVSFRFRFFVLLFSFNCTFFPFVSFVFIDCVVLVRFFSPSQDIGWAEESLRNELFCIEWDIKQLL